MNYRKIISVENYEATNQFVYFEMEGMADMGDFEYVLWSEPILLSLN